MSADEKTFYITTNMPGGQGGYDVWKTVKRSNNKWSEWKNLGPSVNTSGDEITVSITPENKSLFIASNGRLGFGGFDLYRFDFIDSSGSYEAVHLGYPINTVSDDIYYYSVPNNPSHAYYSSERPDHPDMYDIYYVNYEAPILSERNKVTKQGKYGAYPKLRTKDSLALAMAVKEAILSAAKHREDSLHKASLVRERAFLAERERMKKEAEDCEAALRERLQTHGDTLAYKQRRRSTDTFSNQYDNIYTDARSIINPSKGMKIYLNNIYFERGKSNLLSSSIYEVEKVFEFLQNFADVKIEVGGHTSSDGSYAVNQKLSETRAKNVRDYLINKGIAPDRITYRGYNYAFPIEDENTELGKMLNRRVEFIVM
jgi:outer membrane protein OmpA-like peptidoglycan-associated protein